MCYLYSLMYEYYCVCLVDSGI